MGTKLSVAAVLASIVINLLSFNTCNNLWHHHHVATNITLMIRSHSISNVFVWCVQGNRKLYLSWSILVCMSEKCYWSQLGLVKIVVVSKEFPPTLNEIINWWSDTLTLTHIHSNLPILHLYININWRLSLIHVSSGRSNDLWSEWYSTLQLRITSQRDLICSDHGL